MKRVIKGKVYDTEKAKLLGESPTGARLFRTKAGAYFTFDPTLDQISTLDRDQAQYWAFDNLPPGVMEDKPSEDGLREKINISIAPETKSALIRMVEDSGGKVSIGQIVDSMIQPQPASPRHISYSTDGQASICGCYASGLEPQPIVDPSYYDEPVYDHGGLLIGEYRCQFCRKLLLIRIPIDKR